MRQNNYNLVGARYRKITRNAGKWEMVKLGNIVLEAKDGGTPLEKKQIVISILVAILIGVL